jgi:anti-sigma B factor antagonist
VVLEQRPNADEERTPTAVDHFDASVSLGIDRARFLLRGELDMSGAVVLKQRIDAALGYGDPSLVLIDVTELTYCDSCGIRVLLDVAHRCYMNGARFRVVGARKNVRRVLEITNTIQMLNVDSC